MRARASRRRAQRGDGRATDVGHVESGGAEESGVGECTRGAGSDWWVQRREDCPICNDQCSAADRLSEWREQPQAASAVHRERRPTVSEGEATQTIDHPVRSSHQSMLQCGAWSMALRPECRCSLRRRPIGFGSDRMGGSLVDSPSPSLIVAAPLQQRRDLSDHSHHTHGCAGERMR